MRICLYRISLLNTTFGCQHSLLVLLILSILEQNKLVKNDHVILFNLFRTVRQVLGFSALPLELFKLETMIDYKFIERRPAMVKQIVYKIGQLFLKCNRVCGWSVGYSLCSKKRSNYLLYKFHCQSIQLLKHRYHHLCVNYEKNTDQCLDDIELEHP